MEKEEALTLKDVVEISVEISEAVKALGFSQAAAGDAEISYHSWHRWRVQIPGKLDGVYDLDRHTFVD